MNALTISQVSPARNGIFSPGENRPTSAGGAIVDAPELLECDRSTWENMTKNIATRNRSTRRDQQRAQQREVELARQRERTRKLWTTAGFGILAAVAIAAALVFALRQSTVGSPTTVAVAASLGKPTADLPGGPTGQFHYVGQVVRQGSKPELVFIGALYCPFCAAERWPMVKALDQFGNFSGVRSTTNRAGESGFGAIPTFDLTHARYASPYVALDARDTQDQQFNQLQTLTAAEQGLVNRDDPQGSIPLVVVGGYAMTGSGYSPSDIDGKTFSAVQHALRRGDTARYAPDINAEANVITALICHADGERPSSVCGRSTIRHLTARLR